LNRKDKIEKSRQEKKSYRIHLSLFFSCLSFRKAGHRLYLHLQVPVQEGMVLLLHQARQVLLPAAAGKALLLVQCLPLDRG
jgi:hypothetical protein